MNISFLNYSVLQFAIPTIALGVFISGLFFYLYIFLRTKKKSYLSILYIITIGLIFSFCEIYFHYFNLTEKYYNARVCDRIQQMCIVFFLYALPLFFNYLYTLNPRLKRINTIFAHSSLVPIFCILIVAFIIPDSFISTHKKFQLADFDRHLAGRGYHGILYSVRDILIGILMIYALVITTYEIIKYKYFSNTIPVFTGLLVAVIFSISDMYFIYTGHNIILSSLDFSRTSFGLSFFVFCTMTGLFADFINSTVKLQLITRNLKISRERFKNTADLLPTVIAEISSDFDIIYLNKAGIKMFKLNKKVLEKPVSFLRYIHPLNKERFMRQIWDLIKKDDYLEEEIKFKISSKKTITTLINATSLKQHGKIVGIRCAITDLTDLKTAQQQLSFTSYHDSLTGLYNRKAFYEYIETLITNTTTENPQKSAVFNIDFDRFKIINEMYDHMVADLILIEMVSRVKKILRKTDIMFRLQGDEFAIVIEKIKDKNDAKQIAEKLMDLFKKPCAIQKINIFISASIGIALYPEDGATTEKLLRNIDLALVEAKKHRKTFIFFSQEIEDKMQEHIQIEKSLKTAIEKKQFILMYQPIINNKENISGFEALIRWAHPELGIIAPYKFIPIAEETGLIIDIGKWVLLEACRQQVLWQNNFGLNHTISVNISPQQFNQADFVNTVKNVLKKTGINSGSLKLEVTEGTIIEDPESVIKKMKQIYKLGVKIAIDDFGTGYSSLSYLKKFPIESLKIDKIFIDELPDDVDSIALINTIISMAKNLKLQVVAEGVETKEQVDFLFNSKCDLIQGYFFSKPKTADQILQMLN